MKPTAPENWSVYRCGDIIDVRDGTHDTPKKVESGIPLITSKNLTANGIDFDHVTYISEEDHKEIEMRSGVDNGDILFAMIGTIGNPVLVKKHRPFAIKNVALFKFNGSAVYPPFFMRLLESRVIKSQLDKTAKGGNQKFVSLTTLRDLEIPLPPLSEQKRLADILDKADAIQRKRREAGHTLEQLSDSLFRKLSDDSDTPPRTIAELLDKRVLLVHKDGNYGSSYPRKHEFGSDGIPFLSAKHVAENGTLILDGVPRLNEDKARTLTFGWIERGDVLLAHNATVGPVALYHGEYSEALIGTSLTCFRPNPKYLTSEFLFAALRGSHFRRQLEKEMSQTTRNQVPITAQRRLTLYIPERAKQTTFANQLADTYRLREKYARSAGDTDTLFNSLVQRAFRGEL